MNLSLTRSPLALVLSRTDSQTESVADIRRRNLLVLGGAFALLWLPALALDLPVAHWVREHPLKGDLRKLLALSEVFAYGLSVLFIVAIAALLDKKRRWRIVPRLFVCSLGSGLAADLLKCFLARSRPRSANLDEGVWQTFGAWWPAFHPAGLGQKWDSSLQSFPSGHTATAVGLAICLSLLYPRARWLFAALALLATLERIESQAHFLSDTLAGGAMACCICLVSLHFWQSRHNPTLPHTALGSVT